MQLRHGRVSLELHERKSDAGSPLLLLHALRDSGAAWPATVDRWPGPVFALDFSGHGRSGWVRGRAYYPELLAADADTALDRIGPSAVAGAGLGAYVALLLAGARPDAVEAALLMPGAGLAGGGALPDFDYEWDASGGSASDPSGDWDPGVAWLDEDVRPVDYAAALAEAARPLVFVEDGSALPPWWAAARRSGSSGSAAPDLSAGLGLLCERLPAAQS